MNPERRVSRALHAFLTRAPEIPYDLHPDLQTIIRAARAWEDAMTWCRLEGDRTYTAADLLDRLEIE